MKYLMMSLLLLPVLAVLSACESSTVTEQRSASDFLQIVKSPNDKRDYRYLVLDNGLKVLLVSDLTADKSAASLTAFRGSYDDPVKRLGLAHFLEHMLFIGTEKYPEPDGYFKFVQSHGGGSNAYTAIDHTNYFFDIQPEAFHEGLDRFAQFFIAPLFLKEYVEREKNAVNSEYQLQLKEDGWRSFVVEKVAVNQEHPHSRFNIGTLETLKGDVHSDLLKFFKENYSANQMALVVLTNEPLDQMQPWVSEMFSPVANRNLKPVERGMPIYAKGQLPATLSHDNIKNQRRVNYAFPMPALRTLYRKKPVQYLSNLLGHEGDGSLHKLLTSKGWIVSLASGEENVDEISSIMNVAIDLTEEGAAHIPEISGYLFAYLNMLRSGSIEQWLYDEQATVANLAFRFAEKTGSSNVVRGLAPTIEHYPAEDLLVAPYLMEEFDAELTRGYLSYLNPDNVLVSISGPNYAGSSIEPWFNVSYDLVRGPIAIAEVEQDSFSLPEGNPFLPDSLDLIAADQNAPEAVVNTPEAEVYFDTDVEFGVPRAVTHVSLRNAGGFVSLQDASNSQLYAILVQDDLNALAYPALLAGVSYQIAAPPRGFRISVAGYHDKQLVLLNEVFSRLVGLEIDEERFEVLKAEMLKNLYNARRQKPFQQSYGRLRDELVDSSWAPEAMIGVVEKITPDSLVAWRQRVLGEVSLQALVHGNVRRERVDDLMALVESHVSLSTVVVAEPAVAALDGIRKVEVEIEHDDASMVFYVQDDSSSFEDRASSALLKHLIAPGYFSSLRTDQQLGYAVFAASTVFRERGGLSFIIQSPVAGPEELRQRTLTYMQGQVAVLSKMPEEEFEANKGGLIATLTQRDKNLSQRAGRYWSDLDRDIRTFDSNQQLADAVAALSLEDIRESLAIVNRKLEQEFLMVFSSGKFAEGE